MTEYELIEQAKQLISVPSTAGNLEAAKAALDILVRILSEQPGVTIEYLTHHDRPSLLAYVGTTRPEQFAVILNGHVDVVPGKPYQFKPYIKDGKLYGRGAQDMKTAALVMTDVFCQLADKLPYPVGLQIVTDEESGGIHGTGWQIEQGVQSDFVIVGEHNFQKNAIYNAARGICRLDINFSGTAAHGGYLWHGDNALLRATKYAHALLDHYPIPKREKWCTTVNIADIHAGETVYNRVPDAAALHLEFRFIPEDPHFESQASIRNFLRSIDPDIKMNFQLIGPAVHVPTNNAYIQALSEVVERECGQQVAYLSRYGAGDARFYAQAGSQAVEYGLMGDGPHGDNEHVLINDIMSYKRILEQFLLSAANVAANPIEALLSAR